MLEEHARNLGVCILRGHEVLAVREHEDTAELVVQGPDGLSLLTASYIVGADGAGSTIRKQARIAFSELMRISPQCLVMCRLKIRRNRISILA